MGDRPEWRSAEDRERAERIVRVLQRLGCEDPHEWARSEVTENIPQLARFRFLDGLWPQMIDCWDTGVATVPAAQRAVTSGADPEDLARLARAVAYETVFAMLERLEDAQPLPDAPSWILAEVDPAGTPTGRTLDGLHEDLLGLDPSGVDGQDLWS